MAMSRAALEQWVSDHVKFAQRGQTQVSTIINKTPTTGASLHKTVASDPVVGPQAAHVVLIIKNKAKKFAENKGVKPRSALKHNVKEAKAAPAPSRYVLTNKGWVNTKPGVNNRNNAKAEKNSANAANGNENANVGARYSIYNPVNRRQLRNLLEKSMHIPALVPHIANGNQPAAGIIRGLSQLLKPVAQPSTFSAFSGSVLETAAFDAAAVAAGMDVKYFSQDLHGKLASLPRVGPPVMVLKSRFTFARSIKSKEELASRLGKLAWLPIIRAGSHNPFYIKEGNVKRYYQQLPRDIHSGQGTTNANNYPPGPEGGVIARAGGVTYYATPFNELEIMPAADKLYKGYTAVEPDIIIYDPARNIIKIVELKIGPGKAERFPAEAYQLLKAKRSVEMAFERSGRTVPKVELYFVPWFYSKVRGGAKPQFVNITGPKAMWNTREGHELTKNIPSVLGTQIAVLDTATAVDSALGIKSKIATMILHAARSTDFMNLSKALKHLKTHGTFFHGYTNANIMNLHAAVSGMHAAHARESRAAALARVGGNSYASRIKAWRERRALAPARIVEKARKVINQLVAHGELEVKNIAGNYYRPGSLRPRTSVQPVPHSGNLSSSASNVKRRSPSNRTASISELWNRFREYNTAFTSPNALTRYPVSTVRWWQGYRYTPVTNKSKKEKLAGLYRTFELAKSPKEWKYLLNSTGMNAGQVQSAFRRVYGPARGEQVYRNASARSPGAAGPSRRSSPNNQPMALNFLM